MKIHFTRNPDGTSSYTVDIDLEDEPQIGSDVFLGWIREIDKQIGKAAAVELESARVTELKAELRMRDEAIATWQTARSELENECAKLRRALHEVTTRKP